MFFLCTCVHIVKMEKAEKLISVSASKQFTEIMNMEELVE